MRRIITVMALLLSVAAAIPAQDPHAEPAEPAAPERPREPIADPTVPGPLLSGPVTGTGAPVLPRIELRALLVPSGDRPGVAVLEVDGVRHRARAGARFSVTASQAATPGAPAAATSGPVVLVLRVVEVGRDGVVLSVEALGLTLVVS